MILTEAEAVGIKWCPFASLYVFAAPATALEVAPTKAGGPANRYIDGAASNNNPENCRCLGSECMAWMWMTPADASATERYGCCGLAMGARMGHM